MLDKDYDEFSMKIYHGSNCKYLPFNYPCFAQEPKEKSKDEHKDEYKDDGKDEHKDECKDDRKDDRKVDHKKKCPPPPYREWYVCIYCKENYPCPPHKKYFPEYPVDGY